ncbi:hypothetical protein [Cystobacter ferrugineus]|uniref:hypothetical protein n=1 Tax=Cystobacter ferrugineus TaxID=83449 RepID=UPI000AB02C24
MKFFLPDSQDLVDPTFDFEREGIQIITRLEDVARPGAPGAVPEEANGLGGEQIQGGW